MEKAGKFSTTDRGNSCIIGTLCAALADFWSILQMMRVEARLRTVDIGGEDFFYSNWKVEFTSNESLD